MKKIKSIIKIILSFLLGTSITYLTKLFKGTEQIIFIVCVLLILILIAIIIFQKIKENKNTRYAVIIFLLNKNDELLLVLNQTHKILLPPCKTMKTYEMPHQAVERILKHQVSLNKEDYYIDTRFHRKKEKLYRVHDCYSPYATQQEFITKQSKKVRYHYSFIYIYKLKENVSIDDETIFFPQFFTLDEILNIEDDIKPFQDIIQRYKKVLKQINNKEKGKK